MKKLRFWITILIIWLIFFFNIERLNSPVNIRSYTYVFAAIAVVVALAVPKVRWLPYLVLLIIPVPLFLWYKGLWSGEAIWGKALPLTVTQVSAIVLTGLISIQISYGLREFEQLINNLTMGYVGKLPKTFSETQDKMYRELKRARRYQRPLSVITLKVDKESVQVALPKLTEEVQQAMMNEYVLAGITRILDENVSDFGTIALQNNHFIVVLPETSDAEVPFVAQNLEKAVRENLEIKLVTGMASFPNEAITFESLVEQAINDANQKGLKHHLDEDINFKQLKHKMLPQKLKDTSSNLFSQ